MLSHVHHMSTSHCAFPFLHRWPLGLLMPFGHVDKGVMSMGVQIALFTLLGILSRECWVLWQFYFRGIVIPFPVAAAPFSTPTSTAQWFHLLYICCYFLLGFFFLRILILVGVGWYLIMDLLRISPMISDTENLLTCLLAICISSLKKCLYKSFAHFWIGCFLFVCLLLGF